MLLGRKISAIVRVNFSSLLFSIPLGFVIVLLKSLFSYYSS